MNRFPYCKTGKASLASALVLTSALLLGLPVSLLAEPPSAADNRELHVIEVYEGIPHESGLITVYITAKNAPLVLYLCAYQPVKWNLIVEPSVQIEQIILSGYHAQTIAGAPADVPVLTVPYRAGYATTGLSKPTSRQGSYKARTFYIGGIPRENRSPVTAQQEAIGFGQQQARMSSADLPLASTIAMAHPISHGDGPITSESIDRYQTIAVLKFADDPRAQNSGSTAAGLAAHLLTLAGFAPVERMQLASLMKEQELQLTHGDETTMAADVGHLTGAAAVVVGEIHEWAFTRAKTDTGDIVHLPTVSLSMRIIDAEKSTLLFSGQGHFTAPAQAPLEHVAREVLHALVMRFELKAGLISTGSLGFSWTRQVRAETSLFSVTEFNRKSPAYEAGLRLGDILLGCNGSSSRTWKTDWQAKRACQAEANQPVVLDVRRGEQPLTFTVRARNRFVEAGH